MNFVEFGNEFPISGNIKQTFNEIVHFKPLKTLIRTLHTIIFVYDFSYLVLPIQALQNSSFLHSIHKFIQSGEGLPDVIAYKQSEAKIIDVYSYNCTKVLLFMENYTYDIVDVCLDCKVNITENLYLTINEGELKRVFLQNNVISLLTQNSANYHVYSACFLLDDPITKWGFQCEVDQVCEIYAFSHVLYVIKKDGVYGCALDESGSRRFPRSLNLIFKANNLLIVKSISNFYVFNQNDKTIYQIKGKYAYEICKLDVSNVMVMIFIENYIYSLSSSSIILFNSITGELINNYNVPETNQWIISLDESYGIVLIGSKSFAISKYDIPPRINLNSEKEELTRDMKKIIKKTGTVIPALLQLSLRSPVLSATMLENEIKKELNTNYPKDSLQNLVNPSLQKLIKLIQEKPQP